MYNPETQETLGTGHRTDNKQTKHTTLKIKTTSNKYPPKQSNIEFGFFFICHSCFFFGCSQCIFCIQKFIPCLLIMSVPDMRCCGSASYAVNYISTCSLVDQYKKLKIITELAKTETAYRTWHKTGVNTCVVDCCFLTCFQSPCSLSTFFVCLFLFHNPIGTCYFTIIDLI